QQRGVPLTSIAIDDAKVLAAYERKLVLVRPDGHVAWRADQEPADAGVLIDGGRVLVDEGQGDYVWGHISARLTDDPNKFLMKPGCVGIEEMTDDNIITVNIEGDKVSGDWPRHNEVFIHSEVMR